MTCTFLPKELFSFQIFNCSIVQFMFLKCTLFKPRELQKKKLLKKKAFISNCQLKTRDKLLKKAFKSICQDCLWLAIKLCNYYLTRDLGRFAPICFFYLFQQYLLFVQYKTTQKNVRGLKNIFNFNNLFWIRGLGTSSRIQIKTKYQ